MRPRRRWRPQRKNGYKVLIAIAVLICVGVGAGVALYFAFRKEDEPAIAVTNGPTKGPGGPTKGPSGPSGPTKGPSGPSGPGPSDPSGNSPLGPSTMGADDGMYVGELNGALRSYWGCQLPGGSHSSVPPSDVGLLEAECSGNAACKGYYAGGPSKGTWLISTDTEPSECANLQAQEYPYFWRKRIPKGPDTVTVLGVPPAPPSALGLGVPPVPPVSALGAPVPPASALGIPVPPAPAPVIVEETIVLVEETNVDGTPVYTPVPTND